MLVYSIKGRSISCVSMIFIYSLCIFSLLMIFWVFFNSFSDTQTDAILNFEEQNNSIILRGRQQCSLKYRNQKSLRRLGGQQIYY